MSLSPICVLTLLQYFPFEKTKIVLTHIWDIQMIYKHLPLYIGSWICLLWIVVSIGIFVKFVWFQEYDVTGGYTVQDVLEEKDAGLNFFLALILPLFVNDITTWNGLIVMILLLALIVCLLDKTNLYYQNPVLIVLNYKVYQLSFVDNDKLENGTYIAITRGQVRNSDRLNYKVIEDNVLVVAKKR